MNRIINGLIRWGNSEDPVALAIVNIFDAASRELIAETQSNEEGQFEVQFQDDCIENCDRDVLIEVINSIDQRLLFTRLMVLKQAHVYAQIRVPDTRRISPLVYRPTIRLGGIDLDEQALSTAEPELVFNLARALVEPEFELNVEQEFLRFSPELSPTRIARRSASGTPVIGVIDAIIAYKDWPREVSIQVNEILQRRSFVAAPSSTVQHECPNFRITYDPTEVDADESALDVFDPGCGSTVPLTTLPNGGGVPTYIKLLCFWLERALMRYVSSPFGMRNPASGGKIQVTVRPLSPPGLAMRASKEIFLDCKIQHDFLAAIVCHEVFHLVQFEYPLGSTVEEWLNPVIEGGAVWAEDVVVDCVNRYLAEAGEFLSDGYMIRPDEPLTGTAFQYKASLFWRYIAEQHSPRIDAIHEPLIGVETYKNVIEHCEAGTWSTTDVKRAIRDLPWYQDFYEFGYLDPGRLDLMSGETTFGNFALAAVLKDLPTVPDRRFDFMEDAEDIQADEIYGAGLGASLDPQDTLDSIRFSFDYTLLSGQIGLPGESLGVFASKYYRIAIDNAVTNVEVTFDAQSGFDSHIFQIALIDEDEAVREIYRTDSGSYLKRFPNLRDGKHLNRIILVVTAAETGGDYDICVSAESPASDVMVTRWHSAVQTEYEIDSRNWAWTWVSPDIWVDNDLDGIADGEVFFNHDNKLHVRLHNKGNAAASGINVNFWYQDASGGLSDAAWLPVQNQAGITQSLTGLSLAAFASGIWHVDWSPVPSGMSHHFCVRVVVQSSGDPNTDNKRAMSNFGHVRARTSDAVEVLFVRRNTDAFSSREIELTVVPRFNRRNPHFEFARYDLVERRMQRLNPGEKAQDAVRLYYDPRARKRTRSEDLYDLAQDRPYCVAPLRHEPVRPDPSGHYPVPPETLPPGIANLPMFTVVHSIDGLPQGGITFVLFTEMLSP